MFAGSVPGSQFEYTEKELLTTGNTHVFRVAALNVIGESSKSDEVEVIAANSPGQPYAPTKVSASATWLEIAWTAPLSGGTPIRGYRIFVNGHDHISVGPTILNYLITTEIVAGVTYQV